MTANEAAHTLDTLDPEDFFKTNDMAMVSFLRLNGHAPQITEFKGRTCWWAFRVNDRLLDDSEAFMDGSARVEPKSYSRHFDDTLKEMRGLRPPGARPGGTTAVAGH